MFRRSDDRLMMVATAHKIVPSAALGDRAIPSTSLGL
jgi:hypothetical protein